MCSEQPTPLTNEIINIRIERSLREKVSRKNGRQIISALALASFKSKKENVQEEYNPSFIIQGTLYMHFGALYPPTRAQPKLAQIYLYDPANVGNVSMIDIRMNHKRLPSSMISAEKR